MNSPVSNTSSNEEYQGLSYKAGLKTPVKGVGLQEDLPVQTKKRSADTADFRIKYKTEKCKFWELGKLCRYGEKVNNLNKLQVCFRPWGSWHKGQDNNNQQLQNQKVQAVLWQRLLSVWYALPIFAQRVSYFLPKVHRPQKSSLLSHQLITTSSKSPTRHLTA